MSLQLKSLQHHYGCTWRQKNSQQNRHPKLANRCLFFSWCFVFTVNKWRVLHFIVKGWANVLLKIKLPEHRQETYFFKCGPWMHKTKPLSWHLCPLKNSFNLVSVRNMTSTLVSRWIWESHFVFICTLFNSHPFFKFHQHTWL